jgi:hypothetical protein
MRRAAVISLIAVALAGPVLGHVAAAQHSPGASGHHATGADPVLAGQDAFAAIAEIVKILEADPSTDWTTVDLERLRQHLIDMHEVVLRSAVTSTAVPSGLAMEVTGPPRTAQAIQAMVVPHAAELDRMPAWSARAEAIPGGVRLVVLARDPADSKLVARIRGLGFAGLLTQGAHHQPHHLAIARGAGHRAGGHADHAVPAPQR